MVILRYSRGLALASILVACAASAGRAQGTGPDSVDHYKVYKSPATFPPNNSRIRLIDQFADRHVDAQHIELFANPVNKNNEGIRRPDRHYTWWRIRPLAVDPPDPVRDVVVSNQFGAAQPWKLGQPLWVLSPASKNDPTGGPVPDGDHYLCYEALTGPIIRRSVDLVDQFGQSIQEVDTAFCLCNPAEKHHNADVYPVKYAQIHLACYRIHPTHPYNLNVLVRDQFFQGGLPILDDCLLCVPSSKQIVTSVKQSTWGKLRGLYR